MFTDVSGRALFGKRRVMAYFVGELTTAHKSRHYSTPE